ncbi:MAG: FG-GAP-like repeat-containing protein [Thermodesulfobacteriota bacterium]
MRRILSSVLFAFITLLLASVVTATESATVAFVPFSVFAPGDVKYLENGVKSMLTSRLVADAGVRIVTVQLDPGVAPEAMAAQGREQGVAYLIGGSLTALGEGTSLDISVTPTAAGEKAERFYATAERQNELIGAVHTLAAEINARMFQAEVPVAKVTAPAQSSQAAAGPRPAQDMSQHPERAFMGGGGGSNVIRPLRAGFQQFSRSQTLHYMARSMDVADIDGDGVDDVVIAQPAEIKCYHLVENRLQQFARLPLRSGLEIVSVDVADIDGDGSPEIYASAQDRGQPYSLALALRNGQLVELFHTDVYFLRPLHMPPTGMILAGQKIESAAPLAKAIHQLKLTGSGVEEGDRLPVPAGTVLYNFVFADVDNDQTSEIVMIDDRDFLNVVKPGGAVIWRSSATYGGSPVTIGKSPEAGLSSLDTRNALQPEKYKKVTVAPRLVAADLNGDGITDIVAGRNEPRFSKLLSDTRSYDSSEFYGLSWNGVGLDVLWRTRRVDGYVTALQTRKPAGNEAQEMNLYGMLILPTGAMDIVSEAKSTLLTFQVDIAKAPEEGKGEE